MDLGIEGRKAIVCASSRGLGRACALSLARNGVDLALNGRDAEALEETAAMIARETGVRVTPIRGDISDAATQQALVAACGEVDILVNNNGGPPPSDYRALSREAMVSGVTMNMITPIELIQAVTDGMCARRFGRIINITSISVKMPVPGLDLSSGARAGLTAFLAGVIPQLAPHNVTINNILPGFFDTARLRSNMEATAKSVGQDFDAFTAARKESVPARRFGEPEEFGEACAFLCGASAGYITGQNLSLDGGRFPGVW